MDKASFFAKARKTSTVEIDGETYTFRKLTQGEVERMRKDFGTPENALAGFRYVVAAAVVAEGGGQVFNPGDEKSLAEVDYDVVSGIASAIIEFSGLNAKKNSPLTK
ncbi:MAG: hypothetical protein QM754_00710 [Tepidisphaeraceae bacterium]